MQNPTIAWKESWEQFENQLVKNNWKKVSDVNNMETGHVNIPIYEKEGRYLDMSGNFGYIDTINIVDKDKNLIKAVSREKFLENEINF